MIGGRVVSGSVKELAKEKMAIVSTTIAIGIGMYRGKLSATSSQESLHSEHGNGGSLTHLRYYHVFREGELDYLINNYVESLHIISSYYDHANWCVVAEKVNVWTL